MWEYAGMGRTAEGLKTGLKKMKEIRKEFDTNLFIPGSKDGLNIELDKAIHLRDFILVGELVAYDALSRNESCGGQLPRRISNRGRRSQNATTNIISM